MLYGNTSAPNSVAPEEAACNLMNSEAKSLLACPIGLYFGKKVYSSHRDKYMYNPAKLLFPFKYLWSDWLSVKLRFKFRKYDSTSVLRVCWYDVTVAHICQRPAPLFHWFQLDAMTSVHSGLIELWNRAEGDSFAQLGSDQVYLGGDLKLWSSAHEWFKIQWYRALILD